VNHQLERGRREKASLDENIDEINLHIDTTQKELRKVVASKQDGMVDENIVKLEVKRLRDTLFSRAGEVYSLERRQLELHTAMTERNKEIGLHKAMLRAQGKSMETERQTVRCLINLNYRGMCNHPLPLPQLGSSRTYI
jgi:NifB/MoaA-like Fe-S oxidoreductase